MVCTRGVEGGGKGGTQDFKNLSHKSEPKIYLHNYAAGIRGNYHKSSGGFEYPKKSLHLDQPTLPWVPETFLARFPLSVKSL